MSIESLCTMLIEKRNAGILATSSPRVEVASPIGWTWIASDTHTLISHDLDDELLEGLLMGLEECQEYDCETCGQTE